jgi:hypothetical protein
MVKGLGTAGGHGRTGGGQIPIRDATPEKADRMRLSIQKRFLKYAGQENSVGVRLLPDLPLRDEVT